MRDDRPIASRRARVAIGISLATLAVTSVLYVSHSGDTSSEANKYASTSLWEASPDPAFVGILHARIGPTPFLESGQLCRPQPAPAPPSDPALPTTHAYSGNTAGLLVYGIDQVRAATSARVTWVAPNLWGPILLIGQRVDKAGPIFLSRSELSHSGRTDIVLGRQIATSDIQWIQWTTFVLAPVPGCYAISTDDGYNRSVVLFQVAR